MKRLLMLIATTIMAFTLAACGSGEQSQETIKQDDTVNQEIEKQKEPIDLAKLEELIDYSVLSEGDELVSTDIKEDEIKVVMKLAPDKILTEKESAAMRYGRTSDELLANYSGWEQLTIEYVGMGEISMNRSEKETNKFNMDYFPVIKIEGKFIKY